MAQSDPNGLFGVHDVRIYNRSTFDSIAYFRVLGTVTTDFSATFADLKGGSQNYKWDSAIAEFNSEISITGRELSANIIEAALGATVTENAADAAGDVIDEANVFGTSVIEASTGIATITIKAAQKANAKEGWYSIKAVSADTVDVYSLSSADFARGVNKSYEDSDGKITSSALTITASSDTDLDDYGLTLTGGSGVIALTIGDTAMFYVEKPHGGSYHAVIGESPIAFDNVGMIISSEVNNEIVSYMRLFKVKVAGMSFPNEEKAWGEYNLTVSVEYDSTENAIAEYRRSLPE